MTLSSPWMLANALRAIRAGWGFQLNADVTGKICRASLDFLEFGVNSIPCKNNILCLALIPQATESEATYTLTYDDLRCCVATLCTVKACGVEQCDFCSKLEELLADDNVKKYMAGKVYRDQKLPVDTAMCDNFTGWGNFCRNVLGIEPNVCKPHGTGNASYIAFDNRHSLSMLTGIAAASYSHVKYFPNRAAYDDYYDIVVDIADIGVLSFADRAQSMLVEYLTTNYGENVGKWYEEFWTGSRGRMCLAHSGYAGCNNNMGVEVSWRNIKGICDARSALRQFLAWLCHYIMTALGDEHRKSLFDIGGNPNAFIQSPMPTKAMWDVVQGMHRLTLSGCLLLEHSVHDAYFQYRDMLENIMECGTSATPLHLKVKAWHTQNARDRLAHPMLLDRIKSVLMPTQALLRTLDPDGDLDVPRLKTLLAPLQREYQDVVLRDRVPGSMDIKAALKIYKSFHLINRQSTWGDIPLSCDCGVCFANCVCAHTLLFTSLFSPEVCVPASWVAATVSQRKKTKSIWGTAGRRRLRIIEERKDDEKHIDSKVKYLAGPSPSHVIPTPVFPPDSSDDDFQVCACIPCLLVHASTDQCAGRRPRNRS